MKRNEFINEVEELGFEVWELENNDHRPMMIHVKDCEDIIATISETKFAKFDFNGSTLLTAQCVILTTIVTEYSCTPLEER